MENQLVSRNEDFQLFQIIEKCFKHWSWFVLSVVLCCGIAVLYVKSTQKIFQRTAVVLISDEGKPDISTVFSAREHFRGTNVKNEIEIFKSPQLTQEVVERLKLNIKYTREDGFREADLYMRSPIIALFPNTLESETFSFQVELLPDSMILLSDFVGDSDISGSNQKGFLGFFLQKKNDESPSIKTKFHEETVTPIGNIVISPTLYYTPGQYHLPVKVSKNDVNSIASSFLGALSVSLSSKDNTAILLAVEDVSIQRAEDFLNTLIVVYHENWLAEKNKVTLATLTFLDDRIPLIREELKSIDNQLEKFKSRNLVTDTRDAASLYMRESSAYLGRATETNTQLTIANLFRDHLKDNTKTSDPLPTNTGMNHNSLETAINLYNTKLLERNRLIANSSDQAPIIVDLNNSLHLMRQSIIHTVDNLIASLQLQLSSFQTQESKMTGNIASNPSQERQLISIEREQNIKESLYLILLQKREENEMALIETKSNSRVISAPWGSSSPVKPQKFKILLIALFVGFSIPGSIIMGRDTINITVRNKSDLAVLPVPLLGVIPIVKKKRRKEMLLVQENGRGTVIESFRMLRTNLSFICKDNKKVIQFTSLDPGSGKTFMAINLAMSFAISGKKVVLVDLDMRTASLSMLIDYPELGISNMLSKIVTDERYLIEKDYFYEGFDIIPVGPIPANPTELLMNENLEKLIEHLKTKYDYVFIDSTPVDLVADAAIVSQFTDFTVFVVREKFTDRRKLPDIENVYHSGKFKNMYLVLNGSHEIIQSDRYHAYYDNKAKKINMLPRSSANALSRNSGYLTEGTKTKR